MTCFYLLLSAKVSKNGRECGCVSQNLCVSGRATKDQTTQVAANHISTPLNSRSTPLEERVP